MERPVQPWGTVVGFGLVSLATDLVSDGARPLAGPLLAQLGASALLVGLVTGAAEAAAQGLRLIFGPWADRTRKYWTFTIVGYALTAVCVPLLAFAPAAGAVGLSLASVLIIGDRVGKAVRSPAKTVLLASVAKRVGRGRGFAVHKSLDLTGALLGPVIVAAGTGGHRSPVGGVRRPGRPCRDCTGAAGLAAPPGGRAGRFGRDQRGRYQRGHARRARPAARRRCSRESSCSLPCARCSGARASWRSASSPTT